MALLCQLALIILKKGPNSQHLFAQAFVVIAPEFNSWAYWWGPEQFKRIAENKSLKQGVRLKEYFN